MNDIRWLQLPDPDLRALVQGEVIIAFVDAGSVAAGDAVSLRGSGSRPTTDLKPAYRRWATMGAPPGGWTATVHSVAAATSLDPQAGAARHILATAGEGEIAVLRVANADAEPVLSDDAFAARLASLESALRA